MGSSGDKDWNPGPRTPTASGVRVSNASKRASSLMAAVTFLLIRSLTTDTYNAEPCLPRAKAAGVNAVVPDDSNNERATVFMVRLE